MYDCELEISSGEVFHQMTDVYLPTPQPVEVTRRYVSSACASSGLFGWGWLSNLVPSLAINPSAIVWLDPIDGDIPVELTDCDGQKGPALTFFEGGSPVPPGIDPLPPEAIVRRLRGPQRSDFLALRHPDGRREIYASPLPGSDRWTRLVSSDAYANSTSYHYRGQHLAAIRSWDGRELRVGYHHGRVGEISVHDTLSDGRTLTWVRFEYDAQGDLASTADASGIVYHYDYLDHLLVRFRGPNGLVKCFAYDADRRCVATWFRGPRQLRLLDRDPLRRRVLISDSYGRRSLFAFDESGHLIEHVDVLGQSSTRILDPAGAILATVAPDGSVLSTMTYDAETRTLVDLAGSSTAWLRQLDEFGRLIQVRSPSGSIQTFEYDDRGELVGIVFPDGSRIDYFYDAKGHPAGFRDPNGYELWRDTSPDGRTIRLRDEMGILFEQTFDAMDNLLSEVDEGGRRTLFRYRAVDVLSEEIGPSGELTRYEYDDALNLSARVNPLGHAWRIESNPIRQIVAEIDPTGGRISYEYDLEANLVAVVNEQGARMEVFRDELYREVGVQYFDGLRVTYELDALGQRTAVVDARGRRMALEYGPSGSLIGRRFPDGAVERYDQNADGEYSRISFLPPPGSQAPERTVDFEFTAMGLLAKEHSDEFDLEYEWDRAAQLVGIRDSVGGETRYVHDLRYRVREIHEGGRRIVFRHLAGGEIAEITFPNGLRHVFDYDGSGRMAVRTTYAPSGAVLTWRRWEYDADDQLVIMEDWHWGRFEYEYDSAGRLTRVMGGNPPTVEQYAYDPAGNPVVTPLSGTSAFAPGNRLLATDREAIEHDADGNVIRRHEGNSEWRYEWDRDDQLQAVWQDGMEVARFEYDLTNRRRKRHSSEGTRLFLYDSYTLRAEVLPTGTIRHYISLPGLAVPIARWGEEGWFYFTYDQIGTAYEVFDDTGSLIATYHAQAYGGARQAYGPGASSFESPFGFIGQYRDDDTGLHYNHFRYYDPRLCRFISQDPMRLATGANFYAYPANPNNCVDLCGFMPQFECLASWTPCQKAYAREKINAINNAPASRRVKTCTKCRANAQRRDFRSRRCGKNKIGRGRQIDHLHELQAGGPDRCCKNLRAIPKKFNNQLGKQVKKMLKGVGPGKTIMHISKTGCNSKEPCHPDDMAKLAQAPATQEANCSDPPLTDNC